MTIWEAIRQERLDDLETILLREPSKIDEVNEEGVPASFAAAATGNLELVRYIVEYSRANMNVVDDAHRNILHYAVTSGKLPLVKYLVERVGMSPLAGDREGVTPYDLAHASGWTEIESYFAQVVGFSYEEAYRNPIRTGFFPDPSIVRVGEDYYMVNSSFIFFPCIPISHSKDLVHWEIIGHAITNPEWARLDTLEGGRGYWAPDISYYKGRYYICATYRLNDTGTVYRKQMVVSSDRPEGPYSEPVFLDEDGIDPSLFADEDGKRYMLLNRGARIFEVNEDATKQIGPATLLYYGSQKRAPEGPHLLKKDGYYYLFEAEGGTGMGHRITVSRSKSLFGVYEPCPYNPILRQRDEGAALQRCGHGKPVQTPDGRWYMVYLCGRRLEEKYSLLGRETALDPITWTADGWPIVNGLQGPSLLQKYPLPPQTSGELRQEGFGEGDCLSKEWMTPRPPLVNGICLKEGKLFLQGSPLPLSQVGARNILLRRQKHFSFLAQVCICECRPEQGQEMGLICYYDENTWVSYGLINEAGSLRLRVHEHIGDDDILHEAIVFETSEELLLRVETEGLRRRFSYCVPGSSWQEQTVLDNVYYLCDEGLKRGKRFTGALVGVFAYAGELPFTACFREFSYKPKS